jgi:hypothetical protein
LSAIDFAATTLAERADKKSTEKKQKDRLIDTVKPPRADLVYRRLFALRINAIHCPNWSTIKCFIICEVGGQEFLRGQLEEICRLIRALAFQIRAALKS